MLKEFGENYDDINFMEPEVRPRLKKSWPVLKLSKKMASRMYPFLSAVDEGSDHEDYGVPCMRLDDLEVDDGQESEDEDVSVTLPLGKLTIDEQYLVPNDVDNPVLSPLGIPYIKLWGPGIRERLQKARESNPDEFELAVVLNSVNYGNVTQLVDECGIMECLGRKTHGARGRRLGSGLGPACQSSTEEQRLCNGGSQRLHCVYCDCGCRDPR